jgi:hypothetical protein
MVPNDAFVTDPCAAIPVVMVSSIILTHRIVIRPSSVSLSIA